MLWAKLGAHRGGPLPAPRLTLEPARILADGYDAATLSMDSSAAGPPRLTLSNAALGARIEAVTGGEGKWQARVRAGVSPGPLTIRVELPDAAAASAELTLLLDTQDRGEDGTPDFLRLDAEGDQQAFRRWFTYLAEAQYFQEPSARPPEIDDCAALIRYAYREALHAHDSAWADSVRVPVLPAFASVEKYRYPFTPLGAAIFRVRSGPFEKLDLDNSSFLQFADAQTLWRFNTHFVSRDIGRALPGDLLFYRQEGSGNKVTFHSMIYLGESQVHRDGRRYFLYHTGPEGSSAGEMKRLSVEDLTQFPQAEWRPLAGNPSFLGVSRWNILRKGVDDVR
ncbi:MAG TPA: DUF1175 family protein [Bryobacteraceae bacterium]|jgi:hypothetical protein